VADATTTGVEALFSDHALRAGAGPVNLNPRWINDVIAFGGGFPDPGTLPIADIIEATRVALERDGEWALQYAFGSGIPELVGELRKKLARDQGIVAEPENVLITNGASEALGLIFQLFVNPGDAVICEAPFFLGAVHSCQAVGADVHEIPLDDEGMVLSELEHVLSTLRANGRNAKLLYLVPNFQNPTGITYSLERRQAIVRLAREHNVPILEDDAYYDLRFAGEKLPTLYELDGGPRVLYCGTFSKIMSAGMRLGWVIANPRIIAHLSGLKLDYGTNAMASHVAAQFCASGTLVEHISELRDLYRHRRDVMLRALERYMPPTVTWTVPDGGFFIWLTLPEELTGEELGRRAREQGVTVAPGTQFHVHGGGERNVRLSYSYNNDEQIERGIEALSQATGGA
jgi:2-aminoadipate transaminase